MISGVTASVALRVRDARDSFGNDVEAYAEPVEVRNVLVDSPSTDGMGANRPDGVRVDLVLRWPKGWEGDLRGARVELPAPWAAGNPYRVVGVPLPLIEANTPGQWNMDVEVVASDG